MSKIVIATLPEMATVLKAARESYGLTQEKCATAAGKNTATWTYWEQGTTEPGALALARGLAFMGLTLNDVTVKGDVQPLLAEVKREDRALMLEVYTAAKTLLPTHRNALKALCELAKRKG